MERWLSKSRVLLALSAVLLIAALNRHDPMVYGMFVFLATLSALGLLLPWLSLRSMSVLAAGDAEVVEGQISGVQLLLERRSWWPAFMVEVETHWQWGPTTTVLTHTLAVVGARQRCSLGSQIRFPCRGDYRLKEVVLSSGFPLGLLTARRRIAQQGISVRVLPRAQPVSLPPSLGVSSDPLGNLVTRRLGQSFELGALRQHVAGEPIGRVNWRASARSGDLVIQQFQQSGSPLLNLVTDIPAERDLGKPDSPAEQALRIAVGICEAAQAEGVRVLATMPGEGGPLKDSLSVARALAVATPGSLSLANAVARAGAGLAEGSQLVVVVNPQSSPAALLGVLSRAACPVIVYIAAHPSHSAADQASAAVLKTDLAQAGFQVMSRHP
jgi:uncharacterized protein (DUF58 family)